MDLLRLLSTNEIVAQIACFLVILAILRAAFWKKVLAALDARRERIAAELQQAADTRAAAEGLRADYQGKLARIEEEAHARINQAIGEGRRLADEIRDRAEKDAARILENSKESIKAELAEAKESLKNEIVELTIAVTEKIIQEKYTEADDKRVIEDFLKGLEKQ